jgi:hypothetical protein
VRISDFSVWYFVIVIVIDVSRLFAYSITRSWRFTLSFIAWLEPILQGLPKSLAVADQLDRASTWIPLNIAEGNGKFTSPAQNSDYDYEQDYDYES